MVCVNHRDREAVAQCSGCGAYICAECAQKSEPLKSVCGTLCPSCYRDKITQTRDYYSGQRKKELASAIVSLICYVLGWIFAAAIPGMVFTVIGIVLMGIYPAIAWFRFAGKSIDDYDAKHGATYVVTDSGVHRDRAVWLRVVFFFAGLIFGIFITPINIIRWFISAAKNKKTAKMYEAELASL